MDDLTVAQMRKMHDELNKRYPNTQPDNFWFNGKLWSDMTEEEREQTRNILLGENK